MPAWESVWASLQQEEMRRDLLKCQLEGNNNSGKNPKEEEDNVALALKGQQEYLLESYNLQYHKVTKYCLCYFTKNNFPWLSFIFGEGKGTPDCKELQRNQSAFSVQ